MKYTGSNFQIRNNLLRLLIVISLFLTSTPTSALAQSETSLSAEDKTEILEKVWKLIDERYYDPKMNGVNWVNQQRIYRPLIEDTKSDEEFYDVIKKLVGEMNDAHTRFLTPREARERRAKKGTTVGLLISNIEGKTVVEKVMSDAEGELARVQPGMIVRTIDGEPIRKKLLEAQENVGGSSSNRASEILAHRRVLSGDPETSVKIGLTDKNGKDLEVTLVRKVIDETSEVFTKQLPSGVGYIAVTSFLDPIADKFKEALLELSDSPALIIDLRYNGGGNISEVLEMAGYLLDKKYTFGTYVKRSGKTKQSLRTFTAGRKGGQIYSKPVYILTSKFSASGSELFASSLQEFERATVIGSQTCGCLLGISRKHQIIGGGELHLSDIGFISPKGNIYEKIGVTPDKVIDLKLSDIQSGIDKGILEAEKIFDVTANIR